MIPYTKRIAGATAEVVVSRPTAYLDHTATCGCGWKGRGWLDFEPAAREAKAHRCEPKRQCTEQVTVPVVGTRPASSFRRRCERWAMRGATHCYVHRFED